MSEALRAGAGPAPTVRVGPPCGWLAPEAQDSIALRAFVIAYVAVTVPEVVSAVTLPFRATPSAGTPPWSGVWMAGWMTVIGVGLVVTGAWLARRASATPGTNGVLAGRLLALVCRCVAAYLLVTTVPRLVPGWGFDPSGIAGLVVGAALVRAEWVVRTLGVARERATEGGMESGLAVTDRDVARLAMKLFGWLLVAQGAIDGASTVISVPRLSVDPGLRDAMPWLAIASLASPTIFVAAGLTLCRRAVALSVSLAPEERALSVATDAVSLRAIFRLAVVVVCIGALVDAVPETAQVVLRYVPSWREMLADPLGIALTPPVAKTVLAIACIAGARSFAARMYPDP